MSLIYFVHVSSAYTQESLLDSVDDFVLKIPEPRSIFDISHDYHLTLLNMALVQAAKGRAIPKFKIVTDVMSQGRATIELIKGDLLDVYWLGSDQTVEKQLRAIKIPTTRGLIGYRKFIIRRDSTQMFDQITSVDDLKKFVACQGSHWPDIEILTAAQLPVTTTTVYENIFKMLNIKRCDYFPRGYHDTENELFNRKGLYPDLISYDRILLHYPFAVYFFTNKSNEALARWIEEGLEELAKNGAIEALMKKHPLTSHIFPLKNEANTLYLTLPNPLLAPDTNITDRQYWFIPEDFNLMTNLEKSL